MYVQQHDIHQPEADLLRRGLAELLNAGLGGSDDEILRMQAVLLDDPELVEKLRSGVQGGGSAPEVVQQVFRAAPLPVFTPQHLQLVRALRVWWLLARRHVQGALSRRVQHEHPLGLPSDAVAPARATGVPAMLWLLAFLAVILLSAAGIALAWAPQLLS